MAQERQSKQLHCTDKFVFVPVERLSDIVPDRYHAYILPTGDCFILNHDGSKMIKIFSESGVAQDGQSAYEIAVSYGFEGTEEQWLDSLKHGKPGEQGLSAYDVAVKNGFKGSEQEWLDQDFNRLKDYFDPMFGDVNSALEAILGV